jgi:hypothetical protein
MKTTIARNSIPSLLLIPLVLACFGLSPTARAVTPAPDGGYPNDNTAEGQDALFKLTTGTDNTAIGWEALYHNTTGGFNTATGYLALANANSASNTANGYSALLADTTGRDNTAVGSSALTHNTTASGNTAIGADALLFHKTGDENTAIGHFALNSNINGHDNVANGSLALYGGTTGSDNTAIGASALQNNNGNRNTAMGESALGNNDSGNDNTAMGESALINNGGSNNIGLGHNAGSNLTTGSNNIDIGAHGVAGESNTIRIGRFGVQNTAYMQGISGATVASGVTVIVGSNGQLGTVVSSARYKDAIQPMNKASEAILALKPVTFRYKKELDPEGIPQFGLVAEEVEKVNPDLVARDADGKVYTVRYEAVNAMLLNEFLKAHRKMQEQEATITELKSTVAQQQNGMEVFAATLKEQASQIQKVSAQVELSKAAPQTVLNNQ